MGDTAEVIHARLQARIKAFGDGLLPIVEELVAELEQELRIQAGLTDHTLKQLAKMGHPYKTHELGMPLQSQRGQYRVLTFRKGIPKAVRIRREAVLGHDLKLVHVQSKQLYSAIYHFVRRLPNSILGVAGVDAVQVPYLKWVVKGTRYMVPRDFIGRAAVIRRARIHAITRNGINALAHSMNLDVK